MRDLSRRGVIGLVGGAAAWPVVARAQQAATPIIGFLSSGTPQADAWRLAAFRRGLNEAGYIEGRNVASEFRWADEQYDRLPELAVELIRSRPAMIVAVGGPAAALAAKAATKTVPVLFIIAGDPVQLGLVASVNRPGGNATGVSTLFSSVVAKQLEVLHEVMPKAAMVGCLVNPKNPNVGAGLREAQQAARALGLSLNIVNAGTDQEINAAFVMLAQARIDALVVITDPLFNSRPDQLAALAARHALPAIYPYREYATAGGFISYGGTLTEPWYVAGTYASRILKGEKTADLPVQQSSKITLVINLKTAASLRITIPNTLLGRADEVIE